MKFSTFCSLSPSYISLFPLLLSPLNTGLVETRGANFDPDTMSNAKIYSFAIYGSHASQVYVNINNSGVRATLELEVGKHETYFNMKVHVEEKSSKTLDAYKSTSITPSVEFNINGGYVFQGTNKFEDFLANFVPVFDTASISFSWNHPFICGGVQGWFPNESGEIMVPNEIESYIQPLIRQGHICLAVYTRTTRESMQMHVSGSSFAYYH